MKILVLATKAPWPTRDGGRLLLANTLAGLAEAGLRPVLVAPFDGDAAAREEVTAALAAWCVPVLVPARPAGPLPALARALAGGLPFSVARHSLAAVRREAARRLAAERFDLVHAEQLQALPQAAPAAGLGIPVVLRAQNVESDLWYALSRWRRGWRGRRIAAEARRIAAWEGEAVRRAAATAALTEADARRLRELAFGPGSGTEGAPAAPADHVRVVAAPFAPTLRPGSSNLFGDPPVVVLGSRGWLPNEDGAACSKARCGRRCGRRCRVPCSTCSAPPRRTPPAPPAAWCSTPLPARAPPPSTCAPCSPCPCASPRACG